MNQKASKALIISSGLAIFSMFFGAGNLMFPIKTGIISGTYTIFGIAGFLITSILLPLIGLVAIILFNGDYQEFFGRLGNIPGKLTIAACMAIIGPLIVIPRIVTVAHVMMAPFLPCAVLRDNGPKSLLIFSLLFLGITFFGSFRESKIVDVLGYVISPLLLISLTTLIITGFFTAGPTIPATDTPWHLFVRNLIRGYGTLDLMAALFFGTFILNIIKNRLKDMSCPVKKMAVFGLKAGIIGVGLLGLIYVGQSFLGAHFGAGLTGLNDGEAFRDIIFKVVGRYGAAIVGSASLLACFSTSIALGGVLGRYLQKSLLKNKISYVSALAMVLLASLPLSIYGLNVVLKLTNGPITFIGYPALIMLTFCNIAYKLFHFKPVKTPVIITLLLAFIAYII